MNKQLGSILTFFKIKAQTSHGSRCITKIFAVLVWSSQQQLPIDVHQALWVRYINTHLSIQTNYHSSTEVTTCVSIESKCTLAGVEVIAKADTEQIRVCSVPTEINVRSLNWCKRQRA